MKLKLKDGGKYLDGMGSVVKVKKISDTDPFPFVGDSLMRYMEDGRYTEQTGLPTDVFSLIEEIA